MISQLSNALLSSPQPISIRPGPYTVAAATASLLMNLPVPFTKAAIVNPCAKPDAKGKLAQKVVFPAAVLTAEMGTVTGKFAPDRYTIELAVELTAPGTLKSNVMFFGSGAVTTVSGPNVVRLMLESGWGHEPGTMNIWIAVKAKLGDPPVRNGAADGVFFCVKRKKPTCSPSWARTAPKRGTRGLSSSASAAKMAWASGSVPRTMSVKVWARAMAWRKVLTGNWYWQGLMAVWLADVRMPFTPRACSCSC